MPSSSPRRGGPLTLEALRSELAALLGPDFRRSFRDDLLSELRELQKDHAAKVAEAAKLAVRQTLEEMAKDSGNALPLSLARRSTMDVIAAPVVSNVKSATDWVMKRKVNPAYFRGRGTPTPEPLQSEANNTAIEVSRSIEDISYQRLPDSAENHHPQQAHPDHSSKGSTLPDSTVNHHPQQAHPDTSYQRLPDSTVNHHPQQAHPDHSSKEEQLSVSEGPEPDPVEKKPLVVRSPVRSSVLKLLPGEVVESRLASRRTCGRFRKAIKGLVDHPYFEPGSCLFILMTIIYVGLQTDLLARDQALPGVFCWMGHVIILAFSLELVLRLTAGGLQLFTGADRLLNRFDFIIVVVCVGWFLFSAFSSERAWWTPTVSVLRVARILSFSCQLSFVGHLRTLVVSIASSIKSLVWVVVLLVTLTYPIGVMLTHVVFATKLSKPDLPPEAKEDLDRLFGSVQKSMLTLFEAISQGTQWADAMDPLVQYCSPWLKPVFLCYVIFATFALLNSVTGLFVEVAMEVAGEDKKVMIAKNMVNMFVDLDADNSGTVSKEEFIELFANPQMEYYLKELDIDAGEADMLFELLDSDCSGEIDAEELAGGCLRLHGQAKALELAAFMHQFSHFTREFAVWRGRVDLQLRLPPLKMPVGFT